MAGYSDTPLAKKLGIGEGATVALLGAPDRFANELEGLPPSAVVRVRATGTADVIVSFHTERAELERRGPPLLDRLGGGRGGWVAGAEKARKGSPHHNDD